ncbi:hypothetical protein [Thalassiella azotivora]
MPVAHATAVAGACSTIRVDGTAVPVGDAGVAVVLGRGVDPSVAARDLSRLLGRAELIVLWRDEHQVAAERWRGGALQDAPAPVLVLSALPDEVERLLLSTAPPDAEPGAVAVADVPRTAALRSAMALQRAGADPATVRRVRRLELVTSGLVGLAALLLLVVELTRVAGGGGGSWVLVVVTALVLAWAVWRVSGALRRPS